MEKEDSVQISQESCRKTRVKRVMIGGALLILVMALLGGVWAAIRLREPEETSTRPDITYPLMFSQIEKTPCAGEVFFRPKYLYELAIRRKEHDIFLVTVYLFEGDGSAVSQEKALAESERLAALGYRIYRQEEATPQDDHMIIGVFSAEELESLPYSDDYGYVFADIEKSGRNVNRSVDENLRIQG